MGGLRKEDKWRYEGMNFCLRFLEQNGGDVSALKGEIARRGAGRVPLSLSRADETAFAMRVRETVMGSVLLLTTAVLHDTFGFGKVRAKRFIDAFNDAAALIADDCINWTEMEEGVKAVLGLEMHINWHGHPPEGHV